MRNLKRALSLALAAVMVLGMMVIGAGAAYKDFTDIDEIKHEEAVKTLVTLNVIAGKEDGSYYDPTGSLTRAEMAKLVTYVLNGGKEPVLGTKAKPTYSDIKGTWAEAYIEYCSSMGIIAGDGAGKFNPEGTLTGSQAAKMILVAMNYDAAVFEFTGNSWEINVNREANKAGIYEDLDGLNPSATISRDDAAQLVYNAIQSNTMKLTWGQSITTGEITQNYDLVGPTLLKDKFNADIYEGVMTSSGLYDPFGASGTKNRFTVLADQMNNNPILTAGGAPTTAVVDREFKDQDLVNLVGRRVKAIVHDTKDTVYGVYPVDAKNKVFIETTASAVAITDSNTKLKVGDTKYTLAGDAVLSTNGAAATAITVAGLVGTLDVAKGNNVTLISNDNDEKIDVILVNTVAVGTVSYVGVDSFSVSNAIGTADRGIVANSAAGYDSVNQKTEDVKIDGDLAKDAIVLLSEDLYTETDKYTVLEKSTATIEGVRTNNAGANIQFQLDGEWYTFWNKAIPASGSLSSGDSIEFVALGDVLYYTKKVEAANAQNIAFVISAADSVGSVAGMTTGAPQAKLLFADGSKATVNTVDSKGDPDATVDTTMVGRMVTYTKTTSGDYILKLVNTGNTGGFDRVDSGTTVNSNSNGKVSGVNGVDIADDAVVFMMKYAGANATTADEANNAKVYSGKEVKSLAAGAPYSFSTTGVAIAKVNGFEYGKVLVLSTANALPDTFTGKTYGYLTAATYESYDASTTTTWRHFTIWNGEENITVKEASNAGLVNLGKGATIVYDNVGDGIIKNVSVAPNLITTQVSGYDGNKIQLVNESASKKITNDTVVLYVNSETKSGATGGAISIANDTNASGTITAADQANVRYIVSSINTDELALLVVDVNNKMAAAPTLTITTTAPTALELNNGLTNGDVIIDYSGAVTLPATLNVPSGRTLELTSDVTGVTASGALTLNGTLKAGSAGVNLSAATLTTGGNTNVSTTGTLTLKASETLDGTWNVGTLNTLATVTLEAGAYMKVATTSSITTPTLKAGATLIVPDADTSITSATVDAGTASAKTTLVAKGATLATLTALNDNVDITVDKITTITADNAGNGTSVTFKGVQTARTYKAGTYTFDGVPTAAFTGLDAGTKLIFNAAVDASALLPAGICPAAKAGATVTFNAAPTEIVKSNTDDGAFYATVSTTCISAASNIVVGTTYKLTSGCGDSSSHAGWVAQ